MSSKLSTLVHGILIVTFTLLAPGIVRSQDQSPPPAAAPQQSPEAQPAAQPASGTLVTPAPAQPGAAQTEPASEEKAGTYTVKKGDTLWDISQALLKDPFLWPFIWKANPFIANADLIYPGNKLTIPSMAPVERALQAPAEPEKERPVEKAAASEKAEPAPVAAPVPQAEKTTEEPVQQSRLILPEEKPVPVMDKYSMLNAGFVSDEDNVGRITGSEEGKTILGYDDIVYVAMKPKQHAQKGDRFIIYDQLDTVRHPVSGRKYGKLTHVQGVLEIIGQGEKGGYTARITRSFDAAHAGSLLTPYQEPTLFYESKGESKQKDLTGYILQVVDGRTINAQIDVVYLDKGSNQGVEMGDRFLVYTKSVDKAYPRKLIGEVQVFLVKDETATAIVRKSTEPLERGDPIAFKK